MTSNLIIKWIHVCIYLQQVCINSYLLFLNRLICWSTTAFLSGFGFDAMFLAEGAATLGKFCMPCVCAFLTSFIKWYDFFSLMGLATQQLWPLGKTTLCLGSPSLHPGWPQIVADQYCGCGLVLQAVFWQSSPCNWNAAFGQYVSIIEW